jgi:hypothetical protein
MTLGYCSTLATAQGAGNALNTFTTAASLLTGSAAQALHTIAPDDWAIGKQLLIKATIAVGNVVTAQPTFQFDVFFGSTSVFNTGAILTSTTAHTALPCDLEILLTCRAVGSTANLIGQAKITGRPFLVTGAGAVGDLTTLGHTVLAVPQTTPAVGANFSSNASQQVDLRATCSASSASNTVQLFQYSLQDLTCTT